MLLYVQISGYKQILSFRLNSLILAIFRPILNKNMHFCPILHQGQTTFETNFMQKSWNWKKKAENIREAIKHMSQKDDQVQNPPPPPPSDQNWEKFEM